jgi:ATP-dependent Lon protease
MRDFRDAKAMAQTLREALKSKVSLTNSESLELVAKLLGFHDWNVLSARIQADHQSSATKLGTTGSVPIREGTVLPIVPLRDVVLFPKAIAPLFVGRDTTRRAVDHAMASDKRILAVTQRRPDDDNPTPDALYSVGVTASVIDLESLDDGTIRILVKCLERAAVVRWAGVAPFLAAEIALIEESRSQEAEAFALLRAALERLRTFPNINFPFFRFNDVRQPGVAADAIVPYLSAQIDQKQDLLETADVVARLEKVLALMNADQRAA